LRAVEQTDMFLPFPQISFHPMADLQRLPNPASAMTIILTRHGKPLLPRTEWIAAAEMGRWIEGYNRSEVAARRLG